MKEQSSVIPHDKEWINLMQEAKQLGISMEEVKRFINKSQSIDRGGENSERETIIY